MTPARTLYLVCYDIADPRRLARVRRFLTDYKTGGQKSFFECWLTATERAQLQARLADLIEPLHDKVHLFQLDPRQAVDCLGLATPPHNGPFFIV